MKGNMKMKEQLTGESIRNTLKECIEPISEELERFKVKMMAMPQSEMYNEPLRIFCWKQIAYYVTEHLVDEDDEILENMFNNKQLDNLRKLCEEGVLIETVAGWLMDIDNCPFNDPNTLENFVADALSGKKYEGRGSM